MSNNFLNSSSLRWVTLYLLLALAILLFVVNLIPQISQGSTAKTPPVLTREEMQKTATAIALAATRVAATATANANATATAIAKNPIALMSPPVELPLMGLDARGLMNDNPNAKKAITDQVKNGPDLKQQPAALVIIYVGVDKNDPTKIANAQALVMNIEGILQNMQSPVFTKKTIYQSIVFVGSETDAASDTLTGTSELSQANLEIYLYNTMHP